ncbi:tRNA (adenosine(37)-N6)-threonylcarbamoyltransferase complex ATPase subunit type 1 TsaE [Wenzhouxiangella sp. AB-CW3]|nr:tRNA (adenosine(37)-N6)-threonylcarbamoyltransferase complex ATPase subunit type 1 TsaE [Wenzhouxiangella sp. AB-CW3]
MMALGETLRPVFANGGVVYLTGDLGVGKTTLVRGLLRAFGFQGRVKSPTFGLIESYDIDGFEVHHLDLYRLGHGEEILYLGLEDLLTDTSLMLVEWAEKGKGWLPDADWVIEIGDRSDQSRLVRLIAQPERGSA